MSRPGAGITRIDRYLLRQFALVFVICYISFTGLFIVFDAFNNLDEFIEAAGKQGTLLGLLFEYYSYRCVVFFDRACGGLALVAAMFTVTWIQRYNELVALMAAGISRGRVARPVILAAVAVSLLGAANRELVVPRLRPYLSRNPKDLLGDLPQELHPRYDNETDVLLRGSRTYAKEQRISEPNFLLPPALAAWARQIVAETAVYFPPRAGRPGGYLLKGVKQPKGIDQLPSARDGTGRAVVLTHVDQPKWIGPDECFLVSNVSFEQLTGGRAWKQFSSTPDLIRGLRNKSLDFGADIRVKIHARIVQPLLDLTLLLLGLPLALPSQPRSTFTSVAMCFGMVTGYFLVTNACHYLGNIYLVNSALAAWLPLMILGPLAMAGIEPLRK
jgi:lipopolysaccharide export system permease protein